MKKLYVIVAIMLMAAMLFPACTPTAIDCTKANVFCVGLVTDVGKINDKALNQSAWEGIQDAKRDGLVDWIQYIETVDAKDYELNVATFGDAGYKIIVTVGVDLTDATYTAAQKYPDVKFIGVDQYLSKNESHPDWPLTNLSGLIFPEDQAGFLVGALAALMSQSHKIGAVCSKDASPAIWRYGEGYKAGAAYADKRRGITTEVTVVYHNEVSFDKSFDDEPWGATTADRLIDEGIDVVFGAGGMTGNGAVIEGAKRGIYVIGANTDQYLTLPEAAPKILSSAIKLETLGVYELINLARKGQFLSGLYPGKIGFAPFHDLSDAVPADVKAEMNRINQGLVDGSIITNVPLAKPAQ